MFTFLGSLLGFVSSSVPSIFKIIQRKQDNAQELAMIKAQGEIQAKAGARKLESDITKADVAAMVAAMKNDRVITGKSSQWVINLSASVRPCIAYLFFIEFIALTAGVFFGGITIVEFNAVWGQETQAIFAAVISFYYGQRTLHKLVK